jgi:hypothetical protein
MVVIRRNAGGAYVLAELDGALSRLRYAAARIVPYHARSHVSVDISHLTGLSAEDLMAATTDDPIKDTPPDFDALPPSEFPDTPDILD